MKIIATIDPIYNNDECINAEYVGGKVIHLTRQELKTLTTLQQAIDGQSYNWQSFLGEQSPDGRDMSDLFACVYAFVLAKFQVNELKELINKLDNVIMDADIF